MLLIVEYFVFSTFMPKDNSAAIRSLKNIVVAVSPPKPFTMKGFEDFGEPTEGEGKPFCFASDFIPKPLILNNNFPSSS